MVKIGTPLTKTATKVLICGGGELGKELTIELQRFGIEVVVIDRYPNAPAMQVAHRSHTLSMLDKNALWDVIDAEKPDIIIPEIEAIATDVLVEMEKMGIKVIPKAKTVKLTMDRKGIRNLASDLGLKTSPYSFASDKGEYFDAVREVGFPCVVKPIMSSSGKGQTIIRDLSQVNSAWNYSQTGSRAGKGKVIVESLVDFDYEITLLTVRHRSESGQTLTSFCDPIGHRQVNGDYRESWQPHPMKENVLVKARESAKIITKALGGLGVFGVELFVKNDDVYFNEVSPRPHDTGMVTMISQDLSEFALHARALLGLPIPVIRQTGFSASSVILAEGESNHLIYENLESALLEPDTNIRIFGKPEVNGIRRMGVALAKGDSIEGALKKAQSASSKISIKMEESKPLTSAYVK